LFFDKLFALFNFIFKMSYSNITYINLINFIRGRTMALSVEFKVASWNILIERWKDHAKPCLKNVSWDERRELIVQRVRRIDCDVICFQEVDQFNSLAHRMDEIGYHGVFAARNNGENEGCALFFNKRKVEIINDGLKTHFFNDGTGRLIQQVSVRFLTDPNSKPVTFLNTHIVNAHGYHDLEEGFSKRTQEVNQLVAKAREVSDGGNSVIVCGDFNIDANHRSLLNGFVESGFADSLQDSPNNYKPTVLFKGTHQKEGETSAAKRIDFIFSKNIRCIESDVRGDPNNLNSKNEPSDHLPICSTYDISQQTKPPVEQLQLIVTKLQNNDKSAFKDIDQLPKDLQKEVLALFANTIKKS
jgi:exonuclease III